MKCEVVDAGWQCAEVHKAVGTAKECDQHDVDVHKGADCQGGTHWPVLTNFKFPGHPQHVCSPLIVDDVRLGKARDMVVGMGKMCGCVNFSKSKLSHHTIAFELCYM